MATYTRYKKLEKYINGVPQEEYKKGDATGETFDMLCKCQYENIQFLPSDETIVEKATCENCPPYMQDYYYNKYVKNVGYVNGEKLEDSDCFEKGELKGSSYSDSCGNTDIFLGLIDGSGTLDKIGTSSYNDGIVASVRIDKVDDIYPQGYSFACDSVLGTPDTFTYRFVFSMHDANKTFKTVDFEKVKFKNLTNGYQAFAGLILLKDIKYLDNEHFNTSNMWTFGNMFEGDEKIEIIDLSQLDGGNNKVLGYIFKNCKSLNTFRLPLDNHKVTILDGMFYGCASIDNIDLSSYNFDLIFSMNYFFFNCDNLKTFKLPKLNMEYCESIKFMFDHTTMESIDVSNCFDFGETMNDHDIAKNVDAMQMFSYNPNLTEINFGYNFRKENISSTRAMFSETQNIKKITCTEDFKNYLIDDSSVNYLPNVDSIEWNILPITYKKVDGYAYKQANIKNTYLVNKSITVYYGDKYVGYDANDEMILPQIIQNVPTTNSIRLNKNVTLKNKPELIGIWFKQKHEKVSISIKNNMIRFGGTSGDYEFANRVDCSDNIKSESISNYSTAPSNPPSIYVYRIVPTIDISSFDTTTPIGRIRLKYGLGFYSKFFDFNVYKKENNEIYIDPIMI